MRLIERDGIAPTKNVNLEKKSISNAMKIRIHNTLIVTMATYASEAWTIKIGDVKNIHIYSKGFCHFQLSFLCRYLLFEKLVVLFENMNYDK